MSGAPSPTLPVDRTDPLTAVVAPMPEELAATLDLVEARRRVPGTASATWRGKIGATEVLLAVTGDGRRRAAGTLTALLDAFPVARLVVIGVAGGLSPELEPGAVVVAERLLDGRRPLSEPEPGARLRAVAGGARPATVVTGHRLLCTGAEKENARRSLPFEGPSVVDVESAALAAVAAERGIPFVVLRAVCDAAEEALPFDMNVCADEYGSVNRSKVLRYALLHPAVIGPLWEMRRRVSRCSGRLARTVSALLEAEASGGEESR